MSDERLLERLQHMEKNPELRDEGDLNRKISSIINHMQRLLNTRQGSVPIAEDYGIPDVTNSHGEGLTELTERIEKTLQNAIMKFEPRLSRVAVKLLSESDDVLQLRFKLEAVLVTEDNSPIVLETIVSSEGKVNVTT